MYTPTRNPIKDERHKLQSSCFKISSHFCWKFSPSLACEFTPLVSIYLSSFSISTLDCLHHGFCCISTKHTTQHITAALYDFATFKLHLISLLRFYCCVLKCNVMYIAYVYARGLCKYMSNRRFFHKRRRFAMNSV